MQGTQHHTLWWRHNDTQDTALTPKELSLVGKPLVQVGNCGRMLGCHGGEHRELLWALRTWETSQEEMEGTREGAWRRGHGSWEEHQVGEAVPSTGGIMSKRAGHVTESAHMCTCVCLCGYVHTHVRDGLCSHGLPMYTMPASVGHGQQTCAWAEWCLFLEWIWNRIPSPFLVCGLSLVLCPQPSEPVSILVVFFAYTFGRKSPEFFFW